MYSYTKTISFYSVLKSANNLAKPSKADITFMQTISYWTAYYFMPLILCYWYTFKATFLEDSKCVANLTTAYAPVPIVCIILKSYRQQLGLIGIV